MVNDTLGSEGYIKLGIGDMDQYENITNPTPNVWYTLEVSLDVTGYIGGFLDICASNLERNFILWIDNAELDTTPLVNEFNLELIPFVYCSIFISLFYIIRKK